MKKIKVATSNTRGFLKCLFDHRFNEIKFVYKNDDVYEVPSKLKVILTQMITWSIFDYLGIFQIIKVYDDECDMLFSYNRFLKTNKPYVIFVENPSALVNYCWERPKKYIAKRKLKKCFEDKNLKAIVCMSNACYRYFDNLYERPDTVDKLQIYPYIEDDYSFTEFDIDKKVNSRELECLFISSDFELKGGRDIISTFEYLDRINSNAHITLITRKSSIRENDLERINSLRNMTLIEFALSKEELSEYYKKAVVLINPTRRDSFSLVTLEAIKYGCAVLATDVYAIKEMDVDGFNGFITSSMFKIWDEDGVRNKYDRTHPKKTVMSGAVDETLVEWMKTKIELLDSDRALLKQMCINSLKHARNEELSDISIAQKWENLFLKYL